MYYHTLDENVDWNYYTYCKPYKMTFDIKLFNNSYETI